MIFFEAVPKVQLHNIFSTTLFLDLSMFRFLSTYGINIKFGYTYVDDILKFQENRRPVTCCPRTLNVTNPNSEKCKINTYLGS